MMKSIIIALTCLTLSLSLTACGGKNDEGKQYHWSKAHGVLEDCRGVMNKSEQCQKNSNNQQYLFQIDRY
ncbi:hypothetical protein FPQ14_11270 [Gilliamella apicola]|uniref:Lipoprotein n=1 Tax=Gilliamella apicola TaxID=1196095 RepID=A0A556RGB5_9GAMM|nr:hypothetical protein [Gilliamella apicola]TSJ87919.1 hypothetical protein FPQ14_11270 [Gilliamella apicola]